MVPPVELPPIPTRPQVLDALNLASPDLAAGIYEFALVLGGTVSAGAYTAGAIDFLIEALDCFEAEKATSNSPYHKTILKIISGTSGGAVVAAIMARALAYQFPSQYKGAPGIAAGAPRNPLYDIWVELLDLAPMLALGDIGPAVPSLLNVAPIDLAAGQVKSYTGGTLPGPRLWLGGSPLTLLLTHTNLSGLPIEIDFGAGQWQRFISHADHGQFAVTYPWQNSLPAKPYEYALGFTAQKETQGGWDTLTTYALASSAFPIGFIPRDIDRPLYHYYYRAIPTAVTPQTTDDLWIMQLDTTAMLQVYHSPTIGNLRYSTVDGGLVNNEPIELARTALAGLLKRNPRDGALANRGVVLIDPFAGEGDMASSPIRDLLPAGAATLNASLQHARYSTADLVLAIHPDIYSRFMLSAQRAHLSGGKALASAGLDAFMGFASKAFRQHDYFLGRQNCQQFLRTQFVLKKDNPVFVNWTADQVARHVNADGELPLIPLFGSANQDEGTNLWPCDALNPEIFRDALEKRFDAILHAELPQNFWGQILAGIAGAVTSGSAASYVIGLLNKDLADWQLISKPPA